MIGMNAQRSASHTLLVLFGIGIGTRLLLTYYTLPSSWDNGDIQGYMSWARTLADAGPSEFYGRFRADYPPGYLYVLWLIGEVSQSVASAGGADQETIARCLIKIPAILLDACAAFMLYRIARSWSAEINSERAGLFAAGIYLLNPVTVYDSVIWGQTDATGACIMLATLMSLMRGPPELTTLIAILGALVKPQFGVILAPLVGTVLLKRHLISRCVGTDAAEGREPWLNAYGPFRLLTSALVGIIVFYVLVTPFNLGIRSCIDLMAWTAGNYPFLTVNAFNPWALLGSGGKPPLAFAGIIFGIGNWSRDDIPLVGSIAGVTIGSTLLVLGFLIGAARLLWRADRWSIVLVGTYLSMCFFMLPTRVHERYLFPAFAFVPLLAVFDRKWRWAIAALTVGFFMNLHASLTVATSMPLGELFRSRAGTFTSISLHTAVFLFAIWSLRPKAAQFQMVSNKSGSARSWEGMLEQRT